MRLPENGCISLGCVYMYVNAKLFEKIKYNHNSKIELGKVHLKCQSLLKYVPLHFSEEVRCLDQSVLYRSYIVRFCLRRVQTCTYFVYLVHLTRLQFDEFIQYFLFIYRSNNFLLNSRRLTQKGKRHLKPSYSYLSPL